MNREEIRKIDRDSIRNYVFKNLSYLQGSVLDYGCGQQPYKDLIQDYTGYEKNQPLPTRVFDSVLCTQVVQEVDSVDQMFDEIYSLLKPDGYCVLTYNTNWEEYGYPDRWRFTKVGMEEIIKKHGFKVINSELRYGIPFDEWTMAIGYGIVFQK